MQRDATGPARIGRSKLNLTVRVQRARGSPTKSQRRSNEMLVRAPVSGGLGSAQFCLVGAWASSGRSEAGGTHIITFHLFRPLVLHSPPPVHKVRRGSLYNIRTRPQSVGEIAKDATLRTTISNEALLRLLCATIPESSQHHAGARPDERRAGWHRVAAGHRLVASKTRSWRGARFNGSQAAAAPQSLSSLARYQPSKTPHRHLRSAVVRPLPPKCRVASSVKRG
ncbi:hypothetical protein B0J12DRAFT_228393 [Macrophomina phaseolina]|uniref:Uncharacterized protein n=1 Tax=Macrophomina phaseolina TaxID=35725 RepID=A0ABQ8GPR1_9PEZI|nr:hypothetical protein B0J12DRAFT_228393 [Macrophomina phaseolina]